MKKSIDPILLVLLLCVTLPAWAQGPAPVVPQKTAAYVSDQIEVPLRAGASERYKVIGSVRNGTAVNILKVDAARGYTQVRSSTGVRGWLPSEQLTDTPSSREQLAGAREELERLQARHTDLKQHMDEVVARPGNDSLSYPQLYEEALRLRQQLAQYRKVAADTVAIDERNRVLQEQVVALERDLQVVQQENRALRYDSDSSRLMLGVVLLVMVLLVVVMVPRLREQRRAQWSRL